MAVLAVDPSSRRSGGSLLGDRARIEVDPARPAGVHPLDRRRAIASVASRRQPARPPQALAAAFDVVVIETVGVGQSETEVADVADTVAVVLQPALGRRAPVPQGRDHGGARRARPDQGRSGRRRAARPWPTSRPRCASLGAADTTLCAVSSVPPPTGIAELRRCARRAPRGPRPAGPPPPRPAPARARRVRRRARRTRAARARRAPGAPSDGSSEQDPALDVPSLDARARGARRERG